MAEQPTAAPQPATAPATATPAPAATETPAPPTATPPPTPTPTPTPDERNRAILTALYHATDSPNWANSANWLTDAPLDEWYGVYLDSQSSLPGLHWDEVIALDLSGNRLKGEIPVDELGNLGNLRKLDFSYNYLTGEIPPELGNLSNLLTLDFSHNQLTGEIPPELGNLSNLWTLYLSNNQLTGEIPPELGYLGAAGTTIGLQLDRNQFSGCVSRHLEQIGVKPEDLGLAWCE